MPTIFPLPPNRFTNSSELLVRESNTTSQLQSPERRQLANVTENILRENLATIQSLLEVLQSAGEIDYKPVPSKRSQIVYMRAQFKGREKPLPYPVDEE
jgi:hypothetical protein